MIWRPQAPTHSKFEESYLCCSSKWAQALDWGKLILTQTTCGDSSSRATCKRHWSPVVIPGWGWAFPPPNKQANKPRNFTSVTQRGLFFCNIAPWWSHWVSGPTSQSHFTLCEVADALSKSQLSRYYSTVLEGQQMPTERKTTYT